MMHKAIIILGSNSNSKKNIETAKGLLRKTFGDVVFTDTIITPPVGQEYQNSQDFLNAAALIHTDSERSILISKLKKIETELGRQHNGRSIPLDLDVIMFDGQIIGEDYFTEPFVENLIAPLIAK